MSPADQRIAKLVGLPEGETEDRSDEPRNRAANERKQRERQQHRLAMTLAVCHWPRFRPAPEGGGPSLTSGSAPRPR